MTGPGVLLVLICLLGTFDILYFHRHVCRLGHRPESRREVWVHALRGIIYTIQLLWLPNLKLTGGFYALLVALYVVDVSVAWTDVWIEPASRKSQGGLPRGEYFMHIVLSVLVGAYIYGVFVSTSAWPSAPASITLTAADMPQWLRLVLTTMGAGCGLNTAFEFWEIWDRDRRPPPLHIRARLTANLAEVWNYTQDHREHPKWDHRFSNIVMLDDEIKTGTWMRYEKKLLGLTIRGWGRYKLHRPMMQSNFQFGSADPRSLIRRGAGLWRYEPQRDGTIEFSTAYDYQVRWGGFGRLIDRLFFRRLMLRETKKSFLRLARERFRDGPFEVVEGLGARPKFKRSWRASSKRSDQTIEPRGAPRGRGRSRLSAAG